MSDYRFIKISHGFPEHRKTMELSDKAFRQLVTAWCFCARNLTDGHLSDMQTLYYFTRKSLAELLSVGFIHKTADGYQMHQFDEHQMTAADADDLHKKRVEAGRKGGRAKANGLALATPFAKQTPSKPVAEVEVEREVETTTQQTTSVGAATNTQRGTRLPTDWQPSPELIAWTRTDCPDVDGSVETDNFRDHFHAVSGQRGVMLDWDLAFKKWMRKEQSIMANRRNGGQRAGRPQQVYGRPGEARSYS